MSIFANPVTAALFPTGTLLAEGTGIEDLGVGDIGVFNADTNLAIDATTAEGVREFYVAVGVDSTGNGQVDRVARSVGQSVATRNVLFYEGQCYTACGSQIDELTGYNNITCSTDYPVKFVISDPEGFVNYGYQPVNKTFVINTDHCAPCEDCGAADCNQFSVALRSAVNSDPEGLFTVGLFDAADANRVTDLTDVAALALATCPVIQVTGNCGEIKDFCNIPEGYTFPRGSKLTIAFPGWDVSVPTVTNTQALSYEEVSAYDAKFKEYYAFGYDGSPYRLTESGVQFGPKYQADLSAEYITINLGNKFVSNSNPSELNNGGATTVFWNCADEAVVDFVEILDALLPAFNPLEAKIADCDCLPVT